MEKTVQDLFEAFRNFRKLHVSALMQDIPHSEFATLKCISRKCRKTQEHMESNISISDLAEKLHVSPPALSRTLRKLEDKGYIVRNVDVRDRRSVDVQLTVQGNEIMQKAEENMHDFMDCVLGQMEPERIERLIEGLRELYRIAQKELDNRKAAGYGEEAGDAEEAENGEETGYGEDSGEEASGRKKSESGKERVKVKVKVKVRGNRGEKIKVKEKRKGNRNE